MKARRTIPTTPPDVLNELPKFLPEYGFDIVRFDFDSGEHRVFEPAKEKRFIEVLAGYVGQHSKAFQSSKQADAVDKFVNKVRHAIAAYQHRRGKHPQFDRANAKTVLNEALDAVATAYNKLDCIAHWRELSHFLEQIYGRMGRQEQTQLEGSIAEATVREIERVERQLAAYREFSPWVMMGKLWHLKVVLALAAERIEFHPGDFQRDDIAQEFVNELALAWNSATGRLPTCSRPSRRSQKPSPFAALLAAINRGILDPELQSPNDFLEYGIKAVKWLKRVRSDRGAN
jgi:hypothetical protein